MCVIPPPTSTPRHCHADAHAVIGCAAHNLGKRRTHPSRPRSRTQSVAQATKLVMMGPWRWPPRSRITLPSPLWASDVRAAALPLTPRHSHAHAHACDWACSVLPEHVPCAPVCAHNRVSLACCRQLRRRCWGHGAGRRAQGEHDSLHAGPPKCVERLPLPPHCTAKSMNMRVIGRAARCLSRRRTRPSRPRPRAQEDAVACGPCNAIMP